MASKTQLNVTLQDRSGLEQSIVQEWISALAAAGGRAEALRLVDQFPWKAWMKHPGLRRTWISFVTGETSGGEDDGDALLPQGAPRLSSVDPRFHQKFPVGKKDSSAYRSLKEQAEKTERNALRGIYTEPKWRNPLGIDQDVGMARLYLEVLAEAEDALRGKEYDKCIQLAEKKLHFLAGKWDRVAVYHILRSCLEHGDAVLGEKKLGGLREKYSGHMRFHEYFFVHYLENELTACSEDCSDRVLQRINKFADEFPDMVSQCNLKQSRDFFERAGESEEGRQKLLARSLELARNGARSAEGKLWLAFLETRILGGDAGRKEFSGAERLELLHLLPADAFVEDDTENADKVAEDDDAQALSFRLGEKFSRIAKDSPEFDRALRQILALETRMARPRVDVDGNQAETADAEHFSWDFRGRNDVVTATVWSFSPSSAPEPQARVDADNVVDLVADAVLEVGANDRAGMDDAADVAASGADDRSQNKSAGSVMGLRSHRLFAHVPIAWKIGKSLLTEYVRAIRKGWVSRKEKSVGLKPDAGKIVKVKIHSDRRLWCARVFVNAFNKKLLVFDREGNHAGVERAKRGLKGLEVVVAGEGA